MVLFVLFLRKQISMFGDPVLGKWLKLVYHVIEDPLFESPIKSHHESMISKPCRKRELVAMLLALLRVAISRLLPLFHYHSRRYLRDYTPGAFSR